MQIGCGFRIKEIKGRDYVYFWHYEDRGGRSRQVYQYIGPHGACVNCLMRCARTVAKPRRFLLNRTPRGLSTAEIVSQSAGRDGSKIENGKRSNLFPFELPTRRAAGAELVFPSQSLVRKSARLDS